MPRVVPRLEEKSVARRRLQSTHEKSGPVKKGGELARTNPNRPSRGVGDGFRLRDAGGDTSSEAERLVANSGAACMGHRGVSADSVHGDRVCHARGVNVGGMGLFRRKQRERWAVWVEDREGAR